MTSREKVVSSNCTGAGTAFGSARPADAARAFMFAGPRFVRPGHALRVKLNPD